MLNLTHNAKLVLSRTTRMIEFYSGRVEAGSRRYVNVNQLEFAIIRRLLTAWNVAELKYGSHAGVALHEKAMVPQEDSQV